MATEIAGIRWRKEEGSRRQERTRCIGISKQTLNYVISVRRVSVFPAISRILVDFGRLPEIVTARNCNVGKRRFERLELYRLADS